MDAKLNGQSAQILTFPSAKRATAVNLSRKARFAAEVAALPLTRTDYGSGWYHDAAIEDASSERKN